MGTRIRRERRRQYGEKDKQVLRRLWEMLDYVSGRRLAAALPDLIESLERHGERVAEPPVRARLLKISASTIDRLLSEDKRRMRLKGRRGTKPGTLLRHQVPIRTFADWDEASPGSTVKLSGILGFWRRNRSSVERRINNLGTCRGAD